MFQLWALRFNLTNRSCRCIESWWYLSLVCCALPAKSKRVLTLLAACFTPPSTALYVCLTLHSQNVCYHMTRKDIALQRLRQCGVPFTSALTCSLSLFLRVLLVPKGTAAVLSGSLALRRADRSITARLVGTTGECEPLKRLYILYRQALVIADRSRSSNTRKRTRLVHVVGQPVGGCVG